MKQPKDSRSQRLISRVEAARLLRAARQGLAAADIENAGEAIGWALAVLRDHAPARRLKIDYLLRSGNHDAADALIARSLMQDQDHALLRWRYARSLHAQGRLEAADCEIRRVLASRPSHVGALTVGAQIAADLGSHDRAVELLRAALRRRPANRAICCQLIQALLNARCPDEAEALLLRIAAPPAVLTARVLRAQNRLLEAIDCMDQALSAGQPAQSRQEIACELIEMLSQLGDLPRLRAVLSKITVDESADNADLGLRVAVALLGMGEAADASALLSGLADRPSLRNAALQHLVVAHALAGRPADAVTALRDWRGECNRLHPHHARAAQPDPVVELANLWLRGLLGAAMSGQSDARQAGADPSLTVLQPMLRGAMRTFDHALRQDEQALDTSERAVIERHRGTCLAAIEAGRVSTSAGHHLDAAAHVTTQPGPDAEPADIRYAA